MSKKLAEMLENLELLAKLDQFLTQNKELLKMLDTLKEQLNDSSIRDEEIKKLKDHWKVLDVQLQEIAERMSKNKNK